MEPLPSPSPPPPAFIGLQKLYSKTRIGSYLSAPSLISLAQYACLLPPTVFDAIAMPCRHISGQVYNQLTDWKTPPPPPRPANRTASKELIQTIGKMAKLCCKTLGDTGGCKSTLCSLSLAQSCNARLIPTSEQGSA